MQSITQIVLTAGITALACSASSAADQEAAQFQTDFLSGKLTWQNVLDRAKEEGKVSFFYWGGNDVLNVWIESTVGPAMTAHGITLQPNRITNTKDAVDLVLAESAAGKTIGQGSADTIWVNGENFYTLARQELLFGAFAKSLPNSRNFDWDSGDPRSLPNLQDFGTETKAREIPWSSEQYVCAVNRKLVQSGDTPSTFEELESYLTKNPGKFAYVKPPNGVGTTFVLSTIYAHNPDGTGAKPFQKSAGELGADEIVRLIEPGMNYLKSLEPLLLSDKTGMPRYVRDTTTAEGLFRDGEIHFTCDFGTYGAATKIAIGHYPETAEAMIFPKGHMIKNKSFLAIPSNASNPAAALVFANYMASVEAQAKKLGFVGYPPGVDHWMLSSKDVKTIANAAPPHVGVTQAELDANAVPDTNASLVEVIEAVWLGHIGRGSTESVEALVAAALSGVSK
jgi:putative spermidine/putrescine transport system substrate-binding protein